MVLLAYVLICFDFITITYRLQGQNYVINTYFIFAKGLFIRPILLGIGYKTNQLFVCSFLKVRGTKRLAFSGKLDRSY